MSNQNGSNNGNGDTKCSPQELGPPTQGLPPWLRQMRAAAQAAVTEADITEIVKAQVEKAKAGDPKALDFVFNQVLGGQQLKGATFVQNVYPSTGSGLEEPRAERPVKPAATYTPSRRALLS